ncbi:MAG: PAS domain S-box protein, partial [Desulfobacteraceae bacterium]|nr:PAS domain S-box protein [Desulfobacteraceae bacterium]
METKHNREAALSISETRYRTLVETMGDGLSEIDENQVTTYANAMLCRMWGRSKEEILGSRVTQFLDKENRKILDSQLDKRRRGESSSYEIVWNKKDGKKLHTLMTPTPYFDAHGRFKGSFAVITDISKQKKEKDMLEMRVKERTTALEYKTKSLEDMNTALRVLLKNREQDRHILEEQMSLNVRELVLPCVQRLGKTPLDDIQKGCLDMMESTLNEIVSPFLKNLPLAFLHLTPSEIQVANLVKHGK